MRAAGHELIERVAGVAPDGLPASARIAAAQVLEEADQPLLVLRLHGLPTQEGDAVHVGRGDAVRYRLGDLVGKGLAGGEIPRRLVEAVRAVPTAPAHEQRRAHALAVGDIRVLDLRIVHTHVISSKTV